MNVYMKKKLFIIVLMLVCVFSSLFSLPVSAFEVLQGPYDNFVYAPGVYDIAAATDAEEPKYQWCVRVGNGGSASSYMELEDDDIWYGTKTAHLSLITHDGLVYGSGWEDLYFCCKITDKYGKSVYGPDMNMVVFTHAALLEKLEKAEVNYRDHGVRYEDATRPTFIGEADGYKHYESVGDRGLIPWTRTGPLDSDLQMKSEVSVRSEVYVTYDGKTVLYDAPLHGFVPKKYGKNAVIFDYYLVLYVNGAKMETLDRRSTIIDVVVPDPIGYGLTKGETPLYDEQYTQSRILTRVAKGKYIALIEEIGGYYKVAADGYFGYVPKGMLDVGEKISAVAIDIPEPSEYADPALLATLYDTASYTLYPDEPVIWHDDTSGKFLEPGDKFLPGHSYTVSVWLKAKTGKRFPLKNNAPDVQAEINGHAATVRKAYEQDPEQVIEISYDFTHVHNPEKVNRVYPTCTTPGKEMYYRCSCGMEFADYQAQTPITDPNWGYIPPLGHRESEWKSDGTNHYKLCLRRDCGEEIPGTRGTHTGGSATCYHGKYCTVCGLEYGEKGAHEWTSDWSFSDASGHARYCLNLCGQRTPTEPHVPGPAATETSPQVCTVCGYIIAPAGAHSHKLEKKEAVEPSCLTAGNTAYYLCAGCGKLFADEKGTQETTLEKVTLPALGHEAETSWKYNEETHWKICSRCGVVIEGSENAHTFSTDTETCQDCGYRKVTDVPSETSEVPPETAPPEPGSPDTAPGSETDTPAGPSGKANRLKIILITVGIAALVFIAVLIFVAVLVIRKARKKKKNG